MTFPIHKWQGLLSLGSSEAYNYDQFIRHEKVLSDNANSISININGGMASKKLHLLYESQVFSQKQVSKYKDDSVVCLVVYKFNSALGENDKEVFARQLADEFNANITTNIYSAQILYLFIYNFHKNEGIIRADNFGVTKLYYTNYRETLFFANSAQSILEGTGQQKELDHQSLYNYLYFHVLPSPFSIFNNVSILEPGECLRINRDGITKERYWRAKYQDCGFEGPEELHNAFLEAVKANVHDVEHTGAFLSGGLDSSCVSGFYSDLAQRQVPTFSIGFDEAGYDEIGYAKIASKHFNTKMYSYYVTPQDIIDVIPLIARGYSEPFGNSSAVPTYYCAKLAKQVGMTSLLAGDGGDELFGGNERYKKQLMLAQFDRLPDALKKILVYSFKSKVYEHIPVLGKLSSYVNQANSRMPKRMESYNLLDRIGNDSIFNAEFIKSIDLDSPGQYMQDKYDEVEANTILNKMLGYDLKITLADNDIPKVVNMCELSGIDVGFPYFDERLFDLSTRLPDAQKTTTRELRVYFRNAMSNYLPSEILSKKKHGFGLPVGPWMMSNKELNQFVVGSVSRLEGTLLKKGFCENYMNKQMREHPGYYGTLLWVMMILSEWMAYNKVAL